MAFFWPSEEPQMPFEGHKRANSNFHRKIPNFLKKRILQFFQKMHPFRAISDKKMGVFSFKGRRAKRAGAMPLVHNIYYRVTTSNLTAFVFDFIYFFFVTRRVGEDIFCLLFFHVLFDAVVQKMIRLIFQGNFFINMAKVL